MALNPPNPTRFAPLLALALVAGTAAPTLAAPARIVQNPNFEPNPEAIVLDFADGATHAVPLVNSAYPATSDFADLDEHRRDTPDVNDPPPLGAARPSLPDGMAQVGGMIVPEAMLHGAAMVPDAPRALAAEGGTTQGGPDLSEICAFPGEVPAGIYDYDHRPGGETPRFHTVFLNYNGGMLSTGGENSAENMSGIALTGHQYPVYGGGEQRAIAVAQAVAVDLERWAVRVVYEERPPKVLPYTMVMMGGHYSDTTAGPSGGVAPLDCEDFGQRNVCYVFQNTSPATSQANVASQEIGHTLGLGHTSASDSVMAAGYAPTQGGDLGFNDSCANTVQVQGQSAACVGVNKCHCGTGEEQHDVNTLSVTFAPQGLDMVEPTIEITNPEDGQMVPFGEDVFVNVDPWDDVGGYGWKLLLEDESGELLADSVDYDRAMEWKLTGLPVGSYTITTLIQDHADHIVTDTVTIHVVDESTDSDGETETDSGTDGASGTDGDTEGETVSLEEGGDQDDGETDDTPSGSDGDSSGVQGDDQGCSCRTDAPTPMWAAAPLLLLLGYRRRR